MTGLGSPTISEVQTVVASMHGVTKADIVGKSRKRYNSNPRMEAAALARELTGHSFPVLGRHFGGRDHTTILYSFRKVQERAQWDTAMAARLDACRAQLAAIVAKRAAQTAAQGTSSDWSPPPPAAHIVKPDTVVMSIDQRSWMALGGELVAA